MRRLVGWLVLLSGCLLERNPSFGEAGGEITSHGGPTPSDSTSSESWGETSPTGSTTAMASTTAVTSTTTATSSTTDATDASGSTTASPVEVCDGIDNDGDGLVDEFSESNAQCNSCTLFEVDHHAYWICSEPVDWFTHLLRCEAKGAVPIRIDDYATNGTIASYLEFEALSFIWIGANDMEVEGTWVWSDGAPVTFTLWNTDLGQPNNEAPGQHCAVLRDNAYWHDEDCLILRGFGCMTAEP